jgi:hypothetical protein
MIHLLRSSRFSGCWGEGGTGTAVIKVWLPAVKTSISSLLCPEARVGTPEEHPLHKNPRKIQEPDRFAVSRISRVAALTKETTGRARWAVRTDWTVLQA